MGGGTPDFQCGWGGGPQTFSVGGGNPSLSVWGGREPQTFGVGGGKACLVHSCLCMYQYNRMMSSGIPHLSGPGFIRIFFREQLYLGKESLACVYAQAISRSSEILYYSGGGGGGAFMGKHSAQCKINSLQIFQRV